MKTFLIRTKSEDGVVCSIINGMPLNWRTKNARYIVIDRDEVLIDDYKQEIDLVIKSNLGGLSGNFGNSLTKSDFGTVLTVTRNTKSDQGQFLRKLLNDQKTTWMLAPETWQSPAAFDNTDTGLVILRPALGARGIGTVVLDPAKTSINGVWSTICSILNIQDNASWTIEEANNNLSWALRELPGSPVWASDGDKTLFEGAKRLTETTMVVQTYIPDVVREFRVIIGGNNKPVYFVERDRKLHDNIKSNPVTFATIDNVGMENSFSSERMLDLPSYVMEEFQLLLDKRDFSMYGFDLFITKKGHWGVFEFSPEFCVQDVPNDLCFREGKIFIERVIKKASKMKPFNGLT